MSVEMHMLKMLAPAMARPKVDRGNFNSSLFGCIVRAKMLEARIAQIFENN